MKKISIVSACYNEEENVEELYKQVKEQIKKAGEYEYEHIFIDNDSTDRTQEILKKLASQDNNVKVIINSRNFGHIRSPFYGITQSSGDAMIYMASDLQDPPSLIPEFIRRWENGYKMVIAVKSGSQESPLLFMVRKFYYNFVDKLSDTNTQVIKNYTGYGIYDKQVVDIIKTINDPYPYLRGLISEIGFEKSIIEFYQPTRKKGITKNNFYTLYDMAMLGITNHSKIPLRLATFIGFGFSLLFFVVGLGYLIAKLLFWNSFSLGIAPIVVGFFMFASLQLFFIGILGEYIGAIHTQVLKRPLVIEKERINF